MKCTVEKITPETAKEWLADRNKHNYRGLSKQRVKMFSNAMRAGLWELRGDCL